MNNFLQKSKSKLIGKLFAKTDSSCDDEVRTQSNESKKDSASVGYPGYRECIRVFEHERWREESGWGYRNLEVEDPRRYTYLDEEFDEFPSNVEAPDGWEFCTEWLADREGCDDEEGWVYSTDFRAFSSRAYRKLSNVQPLVRRKAWVRYMNSTDPSFNIDDNLNDGDVKPKIDSSVEIGNIENDEEGEEESDESYLNYFTTLGLNANILNDPILLTVGKQMRLIENECRKEFDVKVKEWKSSVVPTYKLTMKELNSRVYSLRNQLKTMASASVGFNGQELAILEEELGAHIESLEATKKKIYFMNTPHIFGSNGVYIGCDDIWLENISGQFVFDLVPSKSNSQIIVLLTGTTTGADSGVSVRLQLSGFKLRCDAGKGVPNMSLDLVKVTLVVRVTIMLTFNPKENKWSTSPKNFLIELLSFKGPFGTRRNVVSATLSLLIPTIREKIISALIPELGLLIGNLPSPFSIRGEFDIKGIDLRMLESPIFKSEKLSNMMGYSSEQMLMFMALQKSLDRGKILTTMQDFLEYRKVCRSNAKAWEQLKSLWNQACILYFEKTQSDLPDSNILPLSFDRLLQATDELLKKQLTIQITIHHLQGEFSLRGFMTAGEALYERWSTTKSSIAENELSNLVLLIFKIARGLKSAKESIQYIIQNVNSASFCVSSRTVGGSEGSVDMKVSKLEAKLPLNYSLGGNFAFTMGFSSPVPFVICSSIDDFDGSTNIELFHVGSSLMTERANFYDWKNRSDFANVGVSSDDQLHQDLLLQSSYENCNDDNSINNIAQAVETIDSAKKSSVNLDITKLSNVRPATRRSIFGSLVNAAATPLRRSSMPGITNASKERLKKPDSATKPKVTIDSFVDISDKSKRDLKRTLEKLPAKDEAVKILGVKVLSPTISLVIEDPSKLMPNTNILSLSINPNYLAERKKPISENDDNSDHSYHTAIQTIELKTNDCLRLCVNISEITINIQLAPLIRFVSTFLNDFELLKKYLGIATEYGSELSEEYFQFVKIMIGRLGKYFLLPNLDLELNLSAKVSTSNDDVIVQLQTIPSIYRFDCNNNQDKEDSSLTTLKLLAKGNIMDVIADMTALHSAVTRCMKVMDKYFPEK